MSWSSSTKGKAVLKVDIAKYILLTIPSLPSPPPPKKENDAMKKAYPTVDFQQPFLSLRCNIWIG